MKKVRQLNRDLLIAYSIEFVSFLFRTPAIKKNKIKGIYLFGSVARGDFDKDSDIDLFIDSDSKETKSIIEKALNKFYNSEDNKKFQLMGIENELKPIAGNLSNWDLKESVENDGLVLYAQSLSSGLRSYEIVTMDSIKNIAQRNRVLRHLSGRKEKHYNDKGVIKQLGGETLNPRVFIIPSENANTILRIISKENIKYQLRKIWM